MTKNRQLSKQSRRKFSWLLASNEKAALMIS
jgi:hypothetical protein